MKLKVMTYNICSGKNLRRELDLEYSASVIRYVQPDLVTLNEVRSHTADIGAINQADELARLTGYYPVFGRSIDIMGGEYGNALLTRLPLNKWEVRHIPDPERTGDGFYEHRSVLTCKLRAGQRQITVMCTHFGLMPGEQQSAVRTVLDLLAENPGPALLMGDLNLTSASPILRPLISALGNTETANPGLLTFPSDVPDVKIDHILHTAHFASLSLTDMDTQCSDHRPLIAELELI